MILEFNHKQQNLKIDLNKGTEIGIPVQREDSVSSFGINGAVYIDYQVGDFIGNKDKGGPCNLETITFTPHGNSTHTECLGHISIGDKFLVNECISDEFYSAKLITLNTSSEESKLDFSTVSSDSIKDYKALIIRTYPNEESKINHNYSGQNAPFIHVDDMKTIVAAGIEHIILDLPSVDPEWDGGALAAHHIFWNYPSEPRMHCSITEFAYIPNEAKDGDYLIKLNISNFISDAAPSRPVIYPIIVG